MTIHDRLLHVPHRDTSSPPRNDAPPTDPRALRRAPWSLLIAAALLATLAWTALLGWLAIRAAGIL